MRHYKIDGRVEERLKASLEDQRLMVEPKEELESLFGRKPLDKRHLTGRSYLVLKMPNTIIPVVHSFTPYNHVYIYSVCISFAHIAYKCHVLTQLIV